MFSASFNALMHLYFWDLFEWRWYLTIHFAPSCFRISEYCTPARHFNPKNNKIIITDCDLAKWVWRHFTQTQSFISQLAYLIVARQSSISRSKFSFVLKIGAVWKSVWITICFKWFEICKWLIRKYQCVRFISNNFVGSRNLSNVNVWMLKSCCVQWNLLVANA